MTFEQFQQTPSWGNKAVCPRCKTSNVALYPGCGCRSEGNIGHIMKWHHYCSLPSQAPTKFYDATNEPDVIGYFEEREIIFF
jgi:hypothetical protein